jgi:hypothetical protein
LGPGPAADCEGQVERPVELGVEFCELAKEAEVLGRGGPRVLGRNAVADKRVLEVGPTITTSVTWNIVTISMKRVE